MLSYRLHKASIFRDLINLCQLVSVRLNLNAIVSLRYLVVEQPYKTDITATPCFQHNAFKQLQR